jgi:hypothetical protein
MTLACSGAISLSVRVLLANKLCFLDAIDCYEHPYVNFNSQNDFRSANDCLIPSSGAKRG